MKSILKIYWRYVFMACMLVGFLVIINLMVISIYAVRYSLQKNQDNPNATRYMTGKYQMAADALWETADGSYVMEEEGIRMMEENGCAFGILLDGNGRVVWDWNKPAEIPEHFSAGDIGAFSKWYLMDYPVFIWRHGEKGLLVIAYPKGAMVRYNMYYERSWLDAIVKYIGIFLMLNAILVFVLALMFGYRFYRSLKPVGEGIDSLAEGKAVRLREKGMTQYLKEKINQTSELLEKQQRELERRDTARTEWIAGVSHDIRTPLSLIVGYADEMETDDVLPERTRQRAGMIRSLSFHIKKLIEDLNLTSKLAYHMQPLRRVEYVPSVWLRQTAVGMINSGEIPDSHDLEISIDEALEQQHCKGDVPLLNRALQNLLGNSVKHNPDGGHILLSAQVTEEGFCFCVRDDGKGIPERICQIVQEDGQLQDAEEIKTSSDRRPHVMGLFVVRQIACAHGGRLWFADGGREVWMSVKSL